MAKKLTQDTTLVRNPNDFEPIVVNGSLVEPNTVYEIVSKDPSDNTPPIYQELGATKERMPGVSNTITLTQGDSGFFSSSPIFNKFDGVRNDWKKREELAQLYYDVFAAPLKMYISEIEKIKIPTDDEFFDKNYPQGHFTVNVGEGVQLNTGNPIERFKLYVALIEGELCMKGKRDEEEKELGLKDEHDMYNQDAQYAFISITERKNKKEQQAEIEMEASFRFGELVRGDKDLLTSMLTYINVPVKKEFSRAELNSLYKTKIENDRAKLKEFVLILEQLDARPNELKIEFELLEKVKSKKGRELIHKEGSAYYFNEVVLGSNLKSVVASLMKRENEEILKQFYFNFE
jgi:hypothetical protein